jgi:hypothetical protein
MTRRMYTVKELNDDGELVYHVVREGGEGCLLDEKLGRITKLGPALYRGHHGRMFATFAAAFGHYRRIYGGRLK